MSKRISIMSTLSIASLVLVLASPVSAATNRTERVSVSTVGKQGKFRSTCPSISANGRKVAFVSRSANLVAGDTNHRSDVFVHNLRTGKTKRVSLSSSGKQATNYSLCATSISANGRKVAFVSSDNNLVAGDHNRDKDVFIHNLHTGKTKLVSRSSSGKLGNEDSYLPSISGNGRWVSFASFATNLVAGEDHNHAFDVFVHNLRTGKTKRASVSSSGEGGGQNSMGPSISDDGHRVAFTSIAGNLAPADHNPVWDVFLRNVHTGKTRLVSVGSAGQEGNEDSSGNVSISASGHRVAFSSFADTFVAGDSGGWSDIFVRKMRTHKTTRVSVSSSGVPANGNSWAPSISPDGIRVAFSSDADNLVEGDINGATDVFVHNMRTGKTWVVSVSSTGERANEGIVANVSISAHGHRVVFVSPADNLVADDTNHTADIFVHGWLPEP